MTRTLATGLFPLPRFSIDHRRAGPCGCRPTGVNPTGRQSGPKQTGSVFVEDPLQFHDVACPCQREREQNRGLLWIEIVRRDSPVLMIVAICDNAAFSDTGGSDDGDALRDKRFHRLREGTQRARADARDDKGRRAKIDGSAGQSGLGAGVRINNLDRWQCADALDIELRSDRVAAREA
jgi:hypothetical protein